MDEIWGKYKKRHWTLESIREATRILLDLFEAIVKRGSNCLRDGHEENATCHAFVLVTLTPFVGVV
jgi:hypothetical protein